MKRIISVVLILCSLFLTACSKNYDSITYTRFIETFKDKEGYIVNNESIKYEDRFERYLVSSNNKVQFLYYEFKNEKEAKEYVSINYKNRKKYKYKSSKNNIIVKCTSGMYFYLIQSDKMVLIGNAQNKSDKREVKRILKELGY